MRSQSVTIANQLGLHARAAARFVQVASKYKAHIKVTRGTQTMDGKSIMGILLLSAGLGAVLTISADGVDEQAAVTALCELVESGFGEDT